MKKRQFVAAAMAIPALATSVVFTSLSVLTAGRELPSSKSIQNDIAVALKTSKPLVVLVSLDHCGLCKIARENYLLSLLQEQSVPVIQVNMGHSSAIADAQGRHTTQAELIKNWQVSAAPTVLFLGKNGQEIAPRLVGGTTSDFYGVYLQERVDQAINTAKSYR